MSVGTIRSSAVVALWGAVWGATFASPTAAARADDVDLVRAPSLSPDGSQVVFSWRGDLWKVPTTGGHAARLTSHPANELRSSWSPDGRTIAFESDRSGTDNVWLMDADGGNVRQLTREDSALSLTGWTSDGAGVTISSRREGDVYPEARPYVVPVAGGPSQRLVRAFGREAVAGPQGAVVAFTRGGSSWLRRGYRGSDNRDVWTAVRAPDPTGRGEYSVFRRLTDWPGNDGRPQWTNVGDLLFTSDREFGTQNVFLQSVSDAGTADGAPTRITSFQGEDVWDLATARVAPVAVCVVWGKLYRIDLAAKPAGAVPVAITAPDDESDRVEMREIGGDVSEAELSPDGKTLAVVAFGDVYVRNVEDKHPTRRVTATAARERDLTWSPDGLKLYFVSAEPGCEVIRTAVVAETRADIREAFDRATGAKPAEKPADKPEEKKPDAEEKKDDAPKDGAKPDDAPKPDDTPKPDDKAAAKPKVPAKKNPADRWQDAVTFKVETLAIPGVPAGDSVRGPMPSPDGKRIAFRRGGALSIFDLEAKDVKPVVAGFDPSIDYRWSPDSQWIAYATDDRDFNSDVWVARADGSAAPVNVSRHPANDGAPRWSADGKVLAFLSERTDHEVDVWRVLLDKKLEAMPPEEFAQFQKDALAEAKKRKPLAPADPRAKPAKKPEPSVLDLDDAWKRLVRVTTLRGDEGNLEILPGGDGFVFRGKNGSDDGLFACNFDGTNLRRLVAGNAVVHQVNLVGDTVVYVSGGRVGTVPAAGGATKSIDVQSRIVLDREEMAAQRFLEAARIVGDLFYDGTMKGLDWPATVARYLPLARGTRTADDFNFVANALLGELNASHLGISMPGRSSPVSEPNGRLGVDAMPVAGGFRVTGVVPYGPWDKGPTKGRLCDIVAVEGKSIATAASLESALAGRVGKETLLTLRIASSEGATPKDASTNDVPTKDVQTLITPIAAGAESELRYDAWAAANERQVHALSQNRLGYLHIRSMNQSSLEDFERDLYAAAEGHEGLVIDVRNNGGGSTADLVLASLMVAPHAYTVPRGADPAYKSGYPRDRLYIQRYVLPSNLLCNEKSFSNAEILAHAFQTLRRGTLVGQTTYGGVISTGSTTTLDGTSVRTPFRGWFLPDGTDMENHGARPDILVPQTPESESENDDAQLRAAVEDLMKRLR